MCLLNNISDIKVLDLRQDPEQVLCDAPFSPALYTWLLLTSKSDSHSGLMATLIVLETGQSQHATGHGGFPKAAFCFKSMASHLGQSIR